MKEYNEKGLEAIKIALHMLESDFPQLKILGNKSKCEIVECDSYPPREYLDVNIHGIINNIEFNTYNVYFSSIDKTKPTQIYDTFIEFYIKPRMAGFNTYEDYQFNMLSKKEQEYVKAHMYDMF